MKKTFIALLLLFSLVFCLFACKKSDKKVLPPNDQPTEDLEEIPPDGEKLFFDENGKLQKIIKYDNGTALWMREYGPNGEYLRYTEYSAFGRIVEDKQGGDITVKISYYDSESSLIEAIGYEYHENGMVSTETAYASNGSVKGLFKYDESGVNTESHFYDLDGDSYVLFEIAVFSYAPDGSPTTTSYYTSDELLSSVCEYNENGDLIKITHYGKDGEITSYTIYTYHSAKIPASEAYYDSFDSIISLSLYGETGTRIKLINYFPSGLPSLIYDYNDSGRISRSSKYGDDGLITFSEEFDENGERIKCTFYNTDRSFLVCDGSYNPLDGVKYTNLKDGGYIKHEYSDSVMRSETVCYDGNQTDEYRIYGEDGFLDEEFFYKNGSLDTRKVYTRDSLGEVTSYTQYEKNGTTLVCSPSGDIISGTRYTYYKGSLHTVYEYENGITVKETVYSGGKVALISQYNENEVLIKESFYSSGKLSRVKEYDSNGVLRKDSIYNAKGKVSSVTKYDENGNKI